ncbi:MAG: MCE family protein [Pseudomonadales bacterium]|nr:MCE family protein [Pseudomonadales bacterium]MCP5329981.1 MCE family protein [Pseudomonadales bacterium]MCP5343111.1 MCE family protein [Pseudomonadales bacterium]
METRAHHILIGLFTLVAAAAALLFALWMSRSTLDSDYRLYDVLFNETVSGLSVGSSVQYSGIRIGEVERLWLDPTDPRRVWARIRVSSTAPIKVDTMARLALLNITGASSIELSQGLPTSALLQAQGGIPIIEAEPSSLTQLRTNSEELLLSVTELLDRANALLAPENANHLSNTLANLDSFTTAMVAQQDTLRDGLAGLVEAGDSLKTLLSRLDDQLSRQGEPLLASAGDTVANLARVSERLDALVNENSDAVGAGLQSLSELAPAMQELRAILSTLSDISRRLEDDPAAFLLGTDNIQEFQP